jgi:hypothetical protein
MKAQTYLASGFLPCPSAVTMNIALSGSVATNTNGMQVTQVTQVTQANGPLPMTLAYMPWQLICGGLITVTNV